MNFNDNYFMKKAIKEAIIAFEKNEVPIGAVIVYNSKIIAKTYNLTHLLKDVTAHAEIQAIGSASFYLGRKYLRECSLYVTLEPCVMCAGALYWSQIGRLIFGASDFKKGFSKKKINLHPKTRIKGFVLSEISKKLLDQFFDNKR